MNIFEMKNKKTNKIYTITQKIIKYQIKNYVEDMKQ